MVQNGLKTTNGLGVSVEDTRICIVMVGLPARGKSLIARKGPVPCSSCSSTYPVHPSKVLYRSACPHTIDSQSYDPEDPGNWVEIDDVLAERLLEENRDVTDWIKLAAMRYFKWLAIEARIFNVGEYRRTDSPSPSADFFSPTNPSGSLARQVAAEQALQDMFKWFSTSDGTIAIFDATNSTRERRAWIERECGKRGVQTMYVESLCGKEDLIMSNILEVKTSSPDYVGMSPEEAAQDFRNRIKNYERVYETIDGGAGVVNGEGKGGGKGTEAHLTYAKIVDVGANVVINNVKNYLQSRIVYYLMNLHIKPRSIWLSRHGESEFNLTGQIGGDANLSPNGEQYALKLPSLLRESVGSDRPLTVWTSTLKRTIATARHLPKAYHRLQWKALDELDAGVCDGLTYQEIKDRYPEDFKARDDDKFSYRYLGGESYRDVVTRLEPIIMELERGGGGGSDQGGDILIITHQAVLRCIVAYFMGKERGESPWMNVPLHTLIKLTPKAYGTEKELISANIEAVSTWRGKGSTAKHETEVPEQFRE